ncbi:MAG: outer membrane lipoprotein carrier protein LolA [Limisphaerales bacterium]
MTALLVGVAVAPVSALASAFASASPNEPAKPTPPRDILGEWLNHQGAVRTWTAAFVQTRSLKTLTQPLKSEGRVWFAAPDRFRWEIGRPAQTIAVRQVDSVIVHYPRLNRAERYPADAGGTGPWAQMLSLLEAGFPRGRADLDKRFTLVSESSTNGLVTLELRPRSASVRRMLPTFRVVLFEADASLRATELVFADGSSLRNEFSETQTNPVLPDGTFEVVLDPDVKVTEPLSPKTR